MCLSATPQVVTILDEIQMNKRKSCGLSKEAARLLVLMYQQSLATALLQYLKSDLNIRLANFWCWRFEVEQRHSGEPDGLVLKAYLLPIPDGNRHGAM